MDTGMRCKVSIVDIEEDLTVAFTVECGTRCFLDLYEVVQYLVVMSHSISYRLSLTSDELSGSIYQWAACTHGLLCQNPLR